MSSQPPNPGWAPPSVSSTDPPPPPASWGVGGSAPPPAPRRSRWKSPKAWGIAIVILLVLGAIGSAGKSGSQTSTAGGTPSPTTSTTPAPLVLVITSNRDGDTVDTPTISVSGMALAGSRVVRSVSLAPDQEVQADSSGTWHMDVELSEGVNKLVFRIGNDASTAQTLAVTYAPIATVTPEPTAEPTLEPTPEPTAEPTVVYATIDDGTWVVGDEIQPGTYRLREPTSCYWARLKGFGGSLGEIIANDNVSGYAVVTVSKSDAGFETNGCGTWTKDLSRVTASRTTFEEGTFIVNTDIKPGTYRSSGGGTCYWARLKGFGGTLGSIISNGLTDSRAIVTIRRTDKGFESQGCGDWKLK